MTGAQVYFGLAGLFIVEDETEQSYDLPRGEFDVPLVIQDRTFSSANEFVYVSDMHQVMQGFWAEQMLVNGQLNYQHEVATRPYRLRLLNGSNARVYKLAWDDDTPLTVIGSDGGLLRSRICCSRRVNGLSCGTISAEISSTTNPNWSRSPSQEPTTTHLKSCALTWRVKSSRHKRCPPSSRR